MSPNQSRLLRKTLFVSLCLGTLGYMLAYGTLSIMSTFGQQDGANDRMLWRTPLTMIVVGLVVTFLADFVLRGLKSDRGGAKPARIVADIVIPPVAPDVVPMAPKLFSPDDQEPRTNRPIPGINSSAASSSM